MISCFTEDILVNLEDSILIKFNYHSQVQILYYYMNEVLAILLNRNFI